MPPWWLLGIGFTHVQILSQYAGSGLFHGMAGLPVSTDVAWFVGMGANILVLLACGAVFRGPRLDRLKRLLAPSIILNIVGFLLSVWPTGVTANDDPVALLGAIALGMGQAIMFLLWADVFNRAKIEEAEIALPLSSLVVLAYAVVVPLLPASLNGIPMLVAPLASGARLLREEHPLPFLSEAAGGTGMREGSRHRGIAAAFDGKGAGAHSRSSGRLLPGGKLERSSLAIRNDGRAFPSRDNRLLGGRALHRRIRALLAQDRFCRFVSVALPFGHTGTDSQFLEKPRFRNGGMFDIERSGHYHLDRDLLIFLSNGEARLWNKSHQDRRPAGGFSRRGDSWQYTRCCRFGRPRPARSDASKHLSCAGVSAGCYDHGRRRAAGASGGC